MAAAKLSYWDRRKDDVYYTMFARYMQIIGFDADSMLDVGGGPIPVLIRSRCWA